MSQPDTAHLFLRNATADCHAQVDAAFGAHDLSTRDGYTAFLKAQAGGFLPAEQALEDAGIAALVPDWPQRKRADLLIADLTVLGEAVPETVDASIDLASDAAKFGAIYVLEGSRLGGKFLLRGIDASLPHAFLAQPQDKGAWRSLLAQLDQALVNDGDRGIAASAARRVFAMFEEAARVSRTG